MKRGGYTLIEMLISVAVFSALVIVVLASVATSSSSSAKINALREKTEATRKVVDQISNDFRYLYTDKAVNDNANGNPNFIGFYFIDGVDGLVMLLRYPGTTADGLVRKQYVIEPINGRSTITLQESRLCRVVEPQDNLECERNQNSDLLDLLASQFVLNRAVGPGGYQSRLSGLDIQRANQSSENGYLVIELTVKPVEYQTIPCNSAQAPSGTCYSVRTTLNAGSL